MTQPTSRNFGLAVKKVLKNHPEAPAGAVVRTKTTSFAGFGYGSSICSTIDLDQRLSDSVVRQLLAVREQYEQQADEGNHFQIELAGPAYPFRQTIRPEEQHG